MAYTATIATLPVMILPSPLAQFQSVIAALPTGPVPVGVAVHPRISIYAASTLPEDVTGVQAQVAAITNGAWAAAIESVDADLRLYELAVEQPSMALGADEVANLISYGMTTVEPGIDLLALAGLNIGSGNGSPGKDISWLADGASRDIAAIFGAIMAARMAGVPVLLAGDAALMAMALLAAMRPSAIGHCTEVPLKDFTSVFGLTAAIAGCR